MIEGNSLPTAVVPYLAEAVPAGSLTVVDVGCSGGIDVRWRSLGRRLRAVGIDPNVAEISRLASAEAHPNIDYVAAFAGLPEGHPFLQRKADRGNWGRNPWGRLSVEQSRIILSASSLSEQEKTVANLWSEVELADPAKQIVLPDYFREIGLDSVDFLKVDVDGTDLDILHSVDADLAALGVLGISVEVNFFGSGRDTDNTLHNTDRFLKERGFELFDLTSRRYSVAALPSRYIYSVPAQTEFGRILQGDALYIRDLANPEYADLVHGLPDEKLINLICIFTIFDLPDCAAEIAGDFRTRLARHFDVDYLLNLLAQQAQSDRSQKLTYAEWMQRFEAQDPIFFHSSSLLPTPLRKVEQEFRTSSRWASTRRFLQKFIR